MADLVWREEELTELRLGGLLGEGVSSSSIRFISDRKGD